jgi:hypothetical protein
MDRLGHISNHINGANYYQPMTNTNFIDTSALGTTIAVIRTNTMYVVASADNRFTGTWTEGTKWLSSINFLNTGTTSSVVHGTTAGSGFYWLSAISMPFTSSLYRNNYSSLLLRAGTRGSVSGHDSVFRLRVLGRDTTATTNAASAFILTQSSATLGGKAQFNFTTVNTYTNGTNILSGTPEICPPFSVSGTTNNYAQMGIHSSDANPTFLFNAFVIQGIQFFRRKSCST